MKLKIALMAAAVALSSSAFAADKKTSISVFGNVSGQSGSDPMGTVSVSIGRLVTDSLELGAQYTTTMSGGSNGITTTMGGVNAKYYFGAVGKGGAVLPYLTVGVLAAGSDTVDTYTMYQAGGGMEFTMTESASTFVEAVATRSKIGNTTSNGYTLQVGVKLRF